MTQISESTKITLDLKTIIIVVGFVITMAGGYFKLQADIEKAKELPHAEIQRMEFELKSKMSTNMVMDLERRILDLEEEVKGLRK